MIGHYPDMNEIPPLEEVPQKQDGPSYPRRKRGSLPIEKGSTPWKRGLLISPGKKGLLFRGK